MPRKKITEDDIARILQDFMEEAQEEFIEQCPDLIPPTLTNETAMALIGQFITYTRGYFGGIQNYVPNWLDQKTDKGGKGE